MFVSIIGWQSKGLRCPDVEVSFLKNSHTRKINLVQMPNGTGKSTIIELISAALTGASRYWSPDKVEQFRNNQSVRDTGSFVLALQTEDDKRESQNRVVFQLDFDFESRTIEHSTVVDENIGLEIGWKAPRDLISFLNDKCVEVFVFKGDKVRKLIEKDRNDAELSIKAFFGLSHMDEIYHLIEEDFKGRQSGVKTEKGLGQKKSILENWQKWLTKLEIEKASIENELGPVRSEYDDIKAKVEDILSGQETNNKKREELQNDRDKCEVDLSMATKESFVILMNPFFISKKISGHMNSLRSNLDSLKLPGTSGEFFKELAEGKDCVCGTTIDKTHRENILKNAKSYLSDDHIEIINGIKKDIKSYTESAQEQEKLDPFGSLKSITNNFYLADQRLKNHIAMMKDEASHQQKDLLDRFEEITKRKNELEKKLGHLTENKGDFRSAARKSPEECKRIPIVMEVINAKEQELSEIQGIVKEFNAKEKLKRILMAALDDALDKIKIDLRQKSNEKLDRILPEGTPLEILQIDKHIQLGFDGRPQESGSGGQNVSVAYSFATSILERSGVQFPLIVDHPVTALQESARRGLGEKLTEICHQFIGFVIDTEKPGFLESLNAIEDDTIFITLFKQIEGNKPYLDLLPADKSTISISDNGVICTDRDFFENFKDLGAELED